MADPLSITASSIALTQAAAKIVEIVKCIKDFKKESADVVQKLTVAQVVVDNLNRRIREADESAIYNRALVQLDPKANKQSAIALLNRKVDDIRKVIAPPTDWQKHIPRIQQAKWYIDRDKIDGYLDEVLYCVYQIGALLSNDHFDLSRDTNETLKKYFLDTKQSDEKNFTAVQESFLSLNNSIRKELAASQEADVQNLATVQQSFKELDDSLAKKCDEDKKDFTAVQQSIGDTKEVISRNFADANAEDDRRFAVHSEELSHLKLGQAEQTELIKKRDVEDQRTKRNAIANWLSPFRFLARYQEVEASSVALGERFLSTDIFRAWENGATWRLYFRASAGAGKTYFSALIIKYLCKNYDLASVPVLYLFLDHKDERMHTKTNLIGSLLSQLIQSRAKDFIPNQLESVYDRTTERPPRYQDVDQCLRRLLTNYERAFVIIDGLDECVGDIRIWLSNDLPDIDPDRLSVLYTMRDEAPDENHRVCSSCGKDPIDRWWSCLQCEVDDMQDEFDICKQCHMKGIRCSDGDHPPPKEPYDELYCTLEFEDTDITAFVAHEINCQMGNKLKKNPRASRASTMTAFGRRLIDYSKRRPTLIDSITKAITDLAGGHVIFAKLCLDAIEDQIRFSDMDRVLGNLSANLDVLYDDFIDRIREIKPVALRELGLNALSALAQQQCPMTFEELQVLMAIEPGAQEFNQDDICETTDFINSSKSLIAISDRQEAGRLVVEARLFHSTLDAYLKEHVDSWGDTHGFIAWRCLTYLQYHALAKPVDIMDDFRRMKEEYPLVTYAALFWQEHVKRAKEEGKLQEAVLDFLRNESLVQSTMRLAWFSQNQSSYVKWDLDFPTGVTSLHLCAWAGLTACLDTLVDDFSSVDLVDDHFEQTPLMLACRRNDTRMVSTLLEHGANLNRQDSRGHSALIEAILFEQVDIVKVLITRSDVNINKRHTIDGTDHVNRTALMIAASKGARPQMDLVVRTLISHDDVDINLADDAGFTALILAVDCAASDIVACLLERPETDLLAKSKHSGWSALSFAVAANNVSIIFDLLSARDRMLSSRHDEISSALDLAFKHYDNDAQLGVIEELLRFLDGDTATIMNESSQTLLHMASSTGLKQYCSSSVNEGVNINAQDLYGQTPLHLACRHGHIDAVAYLITLGADTTLRDDASQTAIATAWAYQHADIQQLLCEKGDESVKEESMLLGSKTMLIWSLARSFDVARLSANFKQPLPYSEELETVTNNTALHTCLDQEVITPQEAQLETLRLLIRNFSLNIEASNFVGRKPLHYAAYWANTPAVQLLLEYGASVDAKDTWGYTPLTRACKSVQPSVGVISVLLEKGADPHVAHALGWGVQKLFFHIVEEGTAAAITKLVVEYGADPQQKNELGTTGQELLTLRGDKDLLHTMRLTSSTSGLAEMKGKTVRAAERELILRC